MAVTYCYLCGIFCDYVPYLWKIHKGSASKIRCCSSCASKLNNSSFVISKSYPWLQSHTVLSEDVLNSMFDKGGL